jgi:hypothetical protein
LASLASPCAGASSGKRPTTERHAVSNAGRPLDDGQLQVLREKHGPKIGEGTAKALVQYYKTQIRVEESA